MEYQTRIWQTVDDAEATLESIRQALSKNDSAALEREFKYLEALALRGADEVYTDMIFSSQK